MSGCDTPMISFLSEARQAAADSNGGSLRGGVRPALGRRRPTKRDAVPVRERPEEPACESIHDDRAIFQATPDERPARGAVSRPVCANDKSGLERGPESSSASRSGHRIQPGRSRLSLLVIRSGDVCRSAICRPIFGGLNGQAPTPANLPAFAARKPRAGFEVPRTERVHPCRGPVDRPVLRPSFEEMA
jgi:hypothetical protein